jgi:hypothetical protein
MTMALRFSAFAVICIQAVESTSSFGMPMPLGPGLALDHPVEESYKSADFDDDDVRSTTMHFGCSGL